MKTIDMVLKFMGYGMHPSKCRIRVYDEPVHTVVIASDLGSGSGTSVTNAAEDIASKVCSVYDINPQRMTWVEHYPRRGEYPDTFDLVEFTILPRTQWQGGKVVSSPSWSPLTKKKVAAMIGEAP